MPMVVGVPVQIDRLNRSEGSALRFSRKRSIGGSRSPSVRRQRIGFREIFFIIRSREENKRNPRSLWKGYANEVGESFRSLVHRHWVTASYGVSSAYVLADTVDKTLKANRRERQKTSYRFSKVAATAADTLIWQALASVIIPGFTINRICALTYYSLSKYTKLPASNRKWTTTAVGLGSIPFIVKPIDTLVDYLLDKLFRPFFVD